MSKLQKAVGYRNRAEELRVLADNFNKQETRDLLYRLASSYENLADGLVPAQVSR